MTIAGANRRRPNEQISKEEQDEEYEKFKKEWESEELAQVKVRVLQGHQKSVNKCMFLDNNKTHLLSCSSDKTCKLWKLDSTTCVKTYNCHDNIIGYMDVPREHMSENETATGTHFLTTAWDKLLCYWDLKTGQNVWRNRLKAISNSCAISPDSKCAASACDVEYVLQIWDVKSGKSIKNLKAFHKSYITHLSFDKTGTRVITSSIDGQIKIFDVRSFATTLKLLNGHQGVVSHAQFSANNRKVVSCGWDKKLCVWDIATGLFRHEGAKMFENGHEGSISSCLLDGNMMVSSSYDQTISVWDCVKGKVKLSLKGHEDWVNDVCLSDDRKWLASSSRDSTIRLWNIEDSERLKYIAKTTSVGLRVLTCENCNKPFSLSLQEHEEVSEEFKKFCFFCRIHLESK
ncbi:uncharacterized protein LOC142342911 [Convolutriloba macropyga]|uniref:uncharacterized protein LOC142342911 n=1 Tax=Convolutriloba macropyga TaxID=536237 RepID=UPI003F521134